MNSLPRLVDTHCHIHDSEFYDASAREKAYQESVKNGIAMICVGTDLRSSRQALEFARMHDFAWPVVGIHPHDAATNNVEELRQLVADNRDEIVGIGEIGLDYFYDNSPRDIQQGVLRRQLEVARDFNLPISFHVRDEKAAAGAVWADFWPIFDEFKGLRGILHSFTDSEENLQHGLERGLYVGVNGISTFTKNKNQQKMFNQIPLERLVFETDAPFLTPVPFRGKVNVPAYVGKVAEFQARVRGISLDDIARITTANTRTLFGVHYARGTTSHHRISSFRKS